MCTNRCLFPAIFLTLLVFLGICRADANEQVDYLTFANGAIPLSISGDGVILKVGYEHALQVIDGNPVPFALTPKPGRPDTRVELLFELPAMTTFSSFAIPNVVETPSPSQTFISDVEVYGSSDGPEAMDLMGRLRSSRRSV